MTDGTFRPPEDAGEHIDTPFFRAVRTATRKLHHAAGIAHDMQSPISVITTSAELLTEKIDEADRERLVAGIGRQARRLHHMLEELLEMARVPSEGGEQVAGDLVDVVRLVHRVAREYRRFKTDHDLVVDSPRGVLFAHAHTENVRRILQNLLDNAYQYSPPGTTVTIRVLLARGKSEVILEVEDQGPGIPEEHTSTVFDPFMRLQATRPGHGLGLYTVRCLALAHGGDAWVERRSIPGACIRVSLPLPGPGRKHGVRRRLRGRRRFLTRSGSRSPARSHPGGILAPHHLSRVEPELPEREPRDLEQDQV